MKIWWVSLTILASFCSPSKATLLASSDGHFLRRTLESTSSSVPQTTPCRDDSSKKNKSKDPSTLPLRIVASEYCAMEGVDVENSVEGGQNVGWISEDDWMAYKVDIPKTALYRLSFRFSSYDGEGSFEIGTYYRTNDNLQILATVPSVDKTGDWQKWETRTLADPIPLAKREQTLFIRVTGGGWNLKWLEIADVDAPIEDENEEGETITPPEETLAPVDEEEGDDPLPVDASDCDAFAIGTTIQAETYCDMEGIEVGDGYYAGWLDAGDWIAYSLQVVETGTYDFTYRVASPEGNGGFEVELYDDSTSLGETIATVDSLPNTGGWQQWQSVTTPKVYLAAGSHLLIFRVTEIDWNLDWFEITRSGQEPDEGEFDEDEEEEDAPDVSDCVFTPLGTTIQAEKYCDMNGIIVGQDYYAGWLDPEDWMAYGLEVEEAGNYVITYRVASPEGRGGFAVELYDDSTNLGEVIATVDSIPRTGDWHRWKTLTSDVYLSAGVHYLVFRVTENDWNLDWFAVTKPGEGPEEEETEEPQEPEEEPDQGRDDEGPVEGNGFVRAAGIKIVDGEGDNLLLRGMGFGGWMIQEPYMMLIESSGQRDMFSKIEELAGTENLNTYRQAWLDNYCTKEDVQELKDSGFNSLRVALHFDLFTLPLEDEPVRGKNTWVAEGFDRLDLLLEWCKEVGIYLILDLHAAPGGQGRDSAISDYDINYPSLWEDDENVRKTIALWVKFAERYKNEPWVAGYDLINEPNWNFVPGHPNGCSEWQNSLLKDFYDRAIPAIRAVDPNHMIIIEGNCWCNNHNGLWPLDDDNIVLSLHRYWNQNNVASIQKFLNWRNQYRVPLWMGESGENDNFWYRDAVQLLEDHNIGWAWWTWKKMESTSGSFSIKKPADYQTLLDYWATGAGPKPSPDFTLNAMMQVAENALLVNAVRNDNAIDALTGTLPTCDDSPSVALDSSGTVRIEAEDACEIYGFRTESTSDVGGGYNMAWTDAGDSLVFNVDVPAEGRYRIDYRVASEEGIGAFQIELQGDGVVVIGGIYNMPATEDWQSWVTVSHDVTLPIGSTKLAIKAIVPGWNINWFEISPV